MKSLLILGAVAVLFTGCASDTYVEHGPRRSHGYYDDGPRYRSSTHVYHDHDRGYDRGYYRAGDRRHVEVNRTTNVRNVRNVTVNREVDRRNVDRRTIERAPQRSDSNYRQTSSSTKTKVKTRKERVEEETPETVRVRRVGA